MITPSGALMMLGAGPLDSKTIRFTRYSINHENKFFNLHKFEIWLTLFFVCLLSLFFASLLLLFGVHLTYTAFTSWFVDRLDVLNLLTLKIKNKNVILGLKILCKKFKIWSVLNCLFWHFELWILGYWADGRSRICLLWYSG